MRTVVFGAILLSVAAIGFQSVIAYSAARDAKTATFAERFAPVLEPAAVN
jgi:hypothetical protein